MNKQHNIPGLCLFIAGCLVTCIGIGHIFMPTLGYDQHVPASMPPAISDHFYYLGTYAICAFLLALGISSIYVSQLPYPRVVLFFSALYSGVWVARAIMEVRYPVKLKLFFLDNPTSVLLPVISIIALVYLTATLLLFWSKIRS